MAKRAKTRSKKKHRQGASNEFDILMTSKPCPTCGVVQLCHAGQTKEEATKDFFARHNDESCKKGMEIEKEFEFRTKQPCSACGALGGGYFCDCWWTATPNPAVESMPRVRPSKKHKKSHKNKSI